MIKAAIVDIDRTLVNIYTERHFIRFLIRKKISYGLKVLFELIWFAIKELPNLHIHSFKSWKGYLRNLKVDDVAEFSDQFFNEIVIHEFNKNVLREISRLKKKNYKIILLSGTVDFIARDIMKKVKADYLISTQLEKKKIWSDHEYYEVYTGKFHGKHAFKQNKTAIVKKFKPKIDLKNSYAFADHYTDAYLFGLVGKPVAVNPDIKLRKLALKNGWKIID